MSDEEDDDASPIRMSISRSAQVHHLLQVGQWRRAKELAAEGIAAEPSSPASYLAMAAVLIGIGDRGAVDAAQQAIRLDPLWPTAWLTAAAALMNAGRYREAEQHLIEAIRLDPEEPSALTRYARLLQRCGYAERALELARRALELDPNDSDAHATFALLLHEVKPSQWRLSEEVARRAISLFPEDDDSFAVLGAILLTQRRLDEAEEALRTALTLNPRNPLAMEGLAQVLMARQPLYRPLLWYGLLMRRLGMGAQLLVVASLYAVVVALHATVVPDGLPSLALTAGYLAVCAYTWFAQPITRAILRRRYRWM
jgi:tetratricopeptide (TPR) repeat protein